VSHYRPRAQGCHITDINPHSSHPSSINNINPHSRINPAQGPGAGLSDINVNIGTQGGMLGVLTTVSHTQGGMLGVLTTVSHLRETPGGY